jgi:hypothetical protein
MDVGRIIVIFLILGLIFFFLSLIVAADGNLVLGNMGMCISVYLFVLAAITAIFEIFKPGSIWIGL